MIVIDPWASEFSKRIATKYGIRASEVYERAIFTKRELGASEPEIENVVETICQLCGPNMGFAEACQYISDHKELTDED